MLPVKITLLLKQLLRLRNAAVHGWQEVENSLLGVGGCYMNNFSLANI
jgi:hypothetical protein